MADQIGFLNPDGSLRKHEEYRGQGFVEGPCLCSDCPGFIVAYYVAGKKQTEWHLKRGIFVDTTPIYQGSHCTVCDCVWNGLGRVHEPCNRYRLPLSGYRGWATRCDECGGSLDGNLDRNQPGSVWTCNTCDNTVLSLELQQKAAKLRKQKYIEMFGDQFEEMLASGEIERFLSPWFGSNFRPIDK